MAISVVHLLASNERRGAETFATTLNSALTPMIGPGETVALSSTTRRLGLKVDHVLAGTAPTKLLRLRRLTANADVVIGHGSRGLPGGTLATFGTSSAFVYRSIGDPRHWSSSSPMRRIRVAAQLRRADRVVALWSGGRDALVADLGVPADRIAVIPNGVDETRFRVASDDQRRLARAQLGLDPDVPTVAVIAAFSPEKRVPMTVAAVAAIEDLQLVVVGDGPELPQVLAALAAMGTRAVRLEPREDLGPVYAAADVVALLSTTEGQSAVLIEAALSGLGIVASRVGGTPSVTTEGLVSVAADVDEIGATIGAQLKLTDEFRHLRRKQAIDRFSMATVARDWANLLSTLAD